MRRAAFRMARRWVVAASAAAVWLGGACAAWGQDGGAKDAGVVVSRPGSTPVIDGHGWLVLRESLPVISGAGGGQKSILFHVPARTGAGEDLHGVVRTATVFEQPAARLAWWRNRVYIALEEEEAKPGSPSTRRVLSMSAIRQVGAGYEYVPHGRAEVLAAMEGGADLVGFAATPAGPVAFVRERGAGGAGGAVSMWCLFGPAWVRGVAPWEVADVAARSPQWRGSGIAQAVTWRAGIGVAMSDAAGERLDVWVGRPAKQSGAEQVPGDAARALLDWSKESFPLTGENVPGGHVAMDSTLAFVEGQQTADDALLAVSWQGGDAKIARLRTQGPVLISSIAEVRPSAMVIPMSAPGDEGARWGTLVLAWEKAAKSSSGPLGAESLQMKEISALTGRELYYGPARNTSLVTPSSFQTLAILLLLVMIGVVMFVLRGDPQVIPVLPKGVRLAEPLRRLAAAVLDYAPCAIIVALAQGRSPMVLLLPQTMLLGRGGEEMDLAPIGMAIGLAALHTGICEWLFGRSLGKLVMGIRVVSVAAGKPAGPEGSGRVTQPRPRLWQALVRNLIRWVVPLLGVFALLDVAGRHPADLAARTLVVADDAVG